MKQLLLVLPLVLSITACSWSDVLGLMSPAKGGIETEIVVGDKEQQVNTEVGTETQIQEADEIINETVNETNISTGFMLLAMLGWFFPSPQELFRMWRSRNDKKPT